MSLVTPPELPEESDPPEVDPRGALQPPPRIPPIALGTRQLPPSEPEYTPGVYSRRLSPTSRSARSILALIFVGAGLVTGSHQARFTALACFALAVLCAYAAMRAEGVERTILRRFRWLRRRRRQGAAAQRRPKIPKAA
jgi:hypothetical protein